jgi:hypothetical protein
VLLVDLAQLIQVDEANTEWLAHVDGKPVLVGQQAEKVVPRKRSSQAIAGGVAALNERSGGALRHLVFRSSSLNGKRSQIASDPECAA